jgi:hypothetical protein
MVVVISGSEVLLGDTLYNIADTKPEPHQGDVPTSRTDTQDDHRKLACSGKPVSSCTFWRRVCRISRTA